VGLSTCSSRHRRNPIFRRLSVDRRTRRVRPSLDRKTHGRRGWARHHYRDCLERGGASRPAPSTSLAHISLVLGIVWNVDAGYPRVEAVKGRLKVLRAERDWTQEQLSVAIGVSRYAINALETERHAPSLDLAFRIAAEFGVRVEEVFPNPYTKG